MFEANTTGVNIHLNYMDAQLSQLNYVLALTCN